MVAELIGGHLDALGLARSSVRRLWLHQANQTMNQWIAAKVLGHDATEDESPSVLAEYGNTSSCGSIIVFHERRQGISVGDVGVVTSFGAGYSAGCVVLKKVRG
jgi:beta-ketodecanoyl-[acyl-carrier-protein] synthase